MKVNKNYQMILNSQDIVEGWLSGYDVDNLITDDINEINIYNNWCTNYDMPKINAKLPDESDNIVSKNTSVDNWNMPNEYKILDIEQYLYTKVCEELQMAPSDFVNNSSKWIRVEEELDLFTQRSMIPVLKFLVYLVDICEENDVVLGVGRGSSVASYVLYLLGIHHIDSIKYNLNIKEFLK